MTYTAPLHNHVLFLWLVSASSVPSVVNYSRPPQCTPKKQASGVAAGGEGVAVRQEEYCFDS